MTISLSPWMKSREVVERVMITGRLELLTPTHLGNGDADGPTDMSLLRDPHSPHQVLLTGASIAGALRNYLRTKLWGYHTMPEPDEQPDLGSFFELFGGQRGDEDGGQSLLIVNDARAALQQTEIRDGVRIDPHTGTAMVDTASSRVQGYKFDLELIPAGTVFELHFELLIPKGKREALKAMLASALQGVEDGDVALGARKRRGFGQCQITQWKVICYDLSDVQQLCAWLKGAPSAYMNSDDKIAKCLAVPLTHDKRDRLTLQGTFVLASPLLIRSEADAYDAEKEISLADTAHLRSQRPNRGAVPVLPGTSLTGVLRHRALRIARTLGSEANATDLITGLFGGERLGADGKKTLVASRLSVREVEIKNTHRLVQTRVKIDRFTGGAYPTGLFSEMPLFGGPESEVTLWIELHRPKPYEAGLLLLLLKDLWTGDLPVGGGNNVGRGRLRGKSAQLEWPTRQLTCNFSQASENTPLVVSKPETLQTYIDALGTYLGYKEANDESTPS
ncbi:MAG: hypothetical protein JXR84_28505 [Anaerolineae bacterium]|nr:hypothetical protein [Anaerolineae bacterium]